LIARCFLSLNKAIQPQPVGDLTWVKAAYESIHGRIISN
jgi:hypothetical protein